MSESFTKTESVFKAEAKSRPSFFIKPEMAGESNDILKVNYGNIDDILEFEVQSRQGSLSGHPICS